MKQSNCITKKQKYTHLKESDRCKIEVLLKEKRTLQEIATRLSRNRSTIYPEVKRGSLLRLQDNLTE